MNQRYKRPADVQQGGVERSLAVTYFPRAIRSIIGAEVFHGPVRDGKAWDHLAMAARHKRVIAGCWVCNRCLVEQSSCWKKCRVLYCIGKYRIDSAYRIKPHGQLVSVSLTHYCASTPDLSTWWSSTTLQGSQAAREVSS